MAELNYEEITVPANSGLDQPVSGSYLKIKTASDDFKIRVNNKSTLAGSSTFEMDETEFNALRFINETGAPITIEYYYGDGKARNNDVSIAGVLAIENNGANKINVDDADTQTKLDSVISELQDIETDIEAVKTSVDGIDTLLQSDEDQRTALTTLAGASYASVSNSTSTVVSSGTNTSGIIIRFGFIDINSVSGASGYIRAGSNDIERVKIRDGASIHCTIRDVFIPSGVALSINASGSDDKTAIYYEVL